MLGAASVANRDWHQSAVEGGPYVAASSCRTSPTRKRSASPSKRATSTGRSVGRPTSPGAPARQLAPKAGVVYVGCVTNSPKLVDKRVRQALLYAIDRKRMTEELREGFGDLTAQPWPSSSPAFDPALESELYEPDRARALLDEAGWSQDEPLTIEPIPGTEVTAEILRATSPISASS